VSTILLSLFLCFFAQSTDITILDTIETLITVPAPPSQETPAEVPFKDLPELYTYGITVRVIIEGQPIVLTKNGEKTETVWWARSISDVQRDLKHTEELYRDVPIQLVVKEVTFKHYTADYITQMFESNDRTGVLTIFYMLPKSFPYDGLSSGPWETFNRGILIDYRADEWTLAHELGHFFGLLHTFEENDYVDDTPPEKPDTNKMCIGPSNSTNTCANCKNIMAYCNHTPKHITRGQIDRFKRFFRAKRQEFLERPKTDLLLRHAEHPTKIVPLLPCE
jgi:hypothetical protein